MGGVKGTIMSLVKVRPAVFVTGLHCVPVHTCVSVCVGLQCLTSLQWLHHTSRDWRLTCCKGICWDVGTDCAPCSPCSTFSHILPLHCELREPYLIRLSSGSLQLITSICIGTRSGVDVDEQLQRVSLFTVFLSRYNALLLVLHSTTNQESKRKKSFYIFFYSNSKDSILQLTLKINIRKTKCELKIKLLFIPSPAEGATDEVSLGNDDGLLVCFLIGPR